MGERPIVEPAAVSELPSEKVAPIYYISVVVLGLTGIVAIVGGIWLTLAGRDIPDLIVALGSAAVGALAGLLAPTSGGGG
jgi:hypothetical protein